MAALSYALADFQENFPCKIVVYILSMHQITWVPLVRLQSAVAQKFDMAILLKEYNNYLRYGEEEREKGSVMSLPTNEPDRRVLEHWVEQCEVNYQKMAPQTLSSSNNPSSKVNKAQKTEI